MTQKFNPTGIMATDATLNEIAVSAMDPQNAQLAKLILLVRPRVTWSKEQDEYVFLCSQCSKPWVEDASQCEPGCARAAWIAETTPPKYDPAFTPPRYDGVYFEGVRAMNEAERD